MKRKKRAFTLLEIMIVIFLIGLIGGVLGYSMKGSLDEGKTFKTKQAKSKLVDIIDLQISQGYTFAEFEENKEAFLKKSGLVKNPKDLIKDGWGAEFEVTNDHGNIKATSQALKDYEAKKKK